MYVGTILLLRVVFCSIQGRYKASDAPNRQKTLHEQQIQAVRHANKTGNVEKINDLLGDLTQNVA